MRLYFLFIPLVISFIQTFGSTTNSCNQMVGEWFLLPRESIRDTVVILKKVPTDRFKLINCTTYEFNSNGSLRYQSHSICGTGVAELVEGEWGCDADQVNIIMIMTNGVYTFKSNYLYLIEEATTDSIKLVLKKVLVEERMEGDIYGIQDRKRPLWAKTILKDNPEIWSKYKVSYYHDPVFFMGDFNGNGHEDYAFLIKSKKSNVQGIMIFHGNSMDYHVIGADSNVLNVESDLLLNSNWQLSKIIISDINADQIVLVNSNGTKQIIKWNGRKYYVENK